MANPLRVPALHDVVRIATPDLDVTVRRYVDYLNRRRPLWSYNPVRYLAAHLLARTSPLQAALHGCSTGGPAAGQPFNAEVAKLVWQAGEGRRLQCHRLSTRYFQIRQDLRLRIPADFYLVEDGEPVVFWLQPRKGFGLDDYQRRLLAAVVRQEVSTEWDEFAFEMLDTSSVMPKGPRVARTFRFHDVPPIPDSEVAIVMQRFADAYDVVSTMERVPVREEGEQPRQSPPDAPLFDQLSRQL